MLTEALPPARRSTPKSTEAVQSLCKAETQLFFISRYTVVRQECATQPSEEGFVPGNDSEAQPHSYVSPVGRN